jgi:DNA-binding response OmpR family regulator
MCTSNCGHILLVEDKPDNLEILALVLTKAGYCVDTARTGGEAIAKIHERCDAAKACYDLVSLDIDLPDVRGTILALFIRAKYSQIPFIFLSAYGRLPAFVDSAKALNAPLLIKPIDPDEYVAAIRAQIDNNPNRPPGGKERRRPDSENPSGQKRRASDAHIVLPPLYQEEIEAVAERRAANS